MPRDITDVFVEEKNLEENKPIVLYELNYEGSNWLYLAEYDEDVTFDGQVYTAFPISHESVSENVGGEVDSVRVKVANVNREIQVYIEQYDAFRGKSIIIKLVWANQLADADAYIQDEFFVDKVVSDENVTEFTLTSKFDVLDIDLPLRKYSRHFCSWVFKSVECGYSGAEVTCNLSLARCRVLNNVLRFGSFPSIPSKIYYGI